MKEMESEKDLSLIFERRPWQWGLRGDPYMWDDLQGKCVGKSTDIDEYDMAHMVFDFFKATTGESLSLDSRPYVEKYAHGGMSSGGLSGEFWISKGIPMLVENLRRVKSGYPIITLCGSTRFKDEFLEIQKRLTLDGNIVISVGLFGHSGDDEVRDGMDEGTIGETKTMLDDMHKRKIDLADEIYVVNVGGYIGESTRSEIEYARRRGKRVRYLETMSGIKLLNASCADQNVEVVVNAANSGLWAGGGICGVIFNKAGRMELAEACSKYQTPLKDGDAVITPAYKMTNAKAIVHAVGPDFGSKPNAFKELYDAYYNSLVVLMENGYHSISFPLISAGIFGGSLEHPAMESTKQCCRAYLKFRDDYPEYDVQVLLCAFSLSEMKEAEEEFAKYSI